MPCSLAKSVEISRECMASVLWIQETGQARKKRVPTGQHLTVNGLHSTASQKVELFITTAVRTSYPAIGILLCCPQVLQNGGMQQHQPNG
jgi:hypothetical protein